MSKAFVKEDNDQDEDSGPDPTDSLGAGSKNYMTPTGAERLRAEFAELHSKERPQILEVIAWAAGNGDRSENADYQYARRRLREIDRRLRYLGRRLDNLEVIDPARETHSDVRFGATVHVLDEGGSELVYTIVGVDETEPARGRVSWVSPIARALLQAKVGDVVTLRTPKGEQDLEVLRIVYKPVLE